MSLTDVLQYIIMPLLSAFIGGLITFLGVRYTIKNEQIKYEKNLKMLNKPYLKISYLKGAENIQCDYINDTFDQDKIDFDKTTHFYCYIINTFHLLNSSNGDCILKEFIIDGMNYSLGDVLVLKNEPINIITTSNTYKNTEKEIKNITISASDVLGNIYYYKCSFKTEYESNPLEATYDNDKKIKIYRLNYTIVNISLPYNQM